MFAAAMASSVAFPSLLYTSLSTGPFRRSILIARVRVPYADTSSPLYINDPDSSPCHAVQMVPFLTCAGAPDSEPSSAVPVHEPHAGKSDADVWAPAQVRITPERMSMQWRMEAYVQCPSLITHVLYATNESPMLLRKHHHHVIHYHWHLCKGRQFHCLFYCLNVRAPLNASCCTTTNPHLTWLTSTAVAADADAVASQAD